MGDFANNVFKRSKDEIYVAEWDEGRREGK